ncbi:sigma-70 family RNA polymerase sigma factor [Azospirillum sp. ST 5-10]|uniref:sigma-70 family RNA polymerase sigma factor n=1 Tax=unclassified Azospirillum TaxID=2630922 RepID=UPI003F49B689
MSDMMRLIEPVIPALRRYARSLTRDRAAADDLVQDCLERVISRWHQWRRDASVRTWMFAILHNLAANRRRDIRRRREEVAVDDADEALLGRPPTQEAALRYRDLGRALATLPEEQRSVLLLVSVEDLSYAEVATVLGIPIGTVMSRLARAREKLLRAVEDDGETRVPKGAPLRSVK